VPDAQLAHRGARRGGAQSLIDLEEGVLDELALLLRLLFRLREVGQGLPWYLVLQAAMQDPIESFVDFWPHYVHSHRNPVNRALHYAGTTAVLGTVATAAVTLNPAWLLLAPVVGYGPAWVGHFVFEHNKPATFQHPLWSLRGDFRMYRLALRGKMRAELERICGGDLPAEHSHEDHLERARAEHAMHTNGTAPATA
jgi:hypothetical protein